MKETKVLGDLYVFVVNPLYAPVTFELEVKSANLQLSAGEKVVRVYPPRSLTLAFSARAADPRNPWSYSYRWKYIMGDVNAAPDEAIYDLPFSPGQAFKINQGYGGTFSHTGVFEYSIDFALPEGTPVYAAREGVVVSMESRYQEGRVDPALKDKANHITILHPDGTLAHYAHLRHGGSLVSVGQTVARGQRIGYSGNTGFSSGPHLHFHVYKAVSASGDWKTLPTRFATAEGERVLEAGLVYARPSAQGTEQARNP